MKRQDFHFELPEELVAQRPAPMRSGSRLMSVPRNGEASIQPFERIIEAFSGDEVLVLNDTRVVPARVRGHKETGGAVEVFFVESLGQGVIKAMLRGKRLRPGTRLILPDASGIVQTDSDDGVFEVLLEGVSDLWEWLERHGEVPLPPYIRRTPDGVDQDRYQTVFARERGAVAAPTAGLHFTTALLDALRAKGVSVCTVTLHVGLGTFMPMRVDEIAAHTMHTERFVIPSATRAAIASGRPIVAVGTTVVRALESYALQPDALTTDIFIYPGYEFRVVDGLLTNFHLPESTLLMLVSAFAGRERVLDAYRQAVEAEMRFFSYGDAMLLRREGGTWI
jgi:S-adenosylmethionine:tRNA ribosyltransferase-isomerase